MNEVIKFFYKNNNLTQEQWDKVCLSIRGTFEELNLRQCTIKKLLDNLDIHKDLNIIQTNIIELPKDLKVRGAVFMMRTKIDKIPEGILFLSRSIAVDDDKIKYFKKKYKSFEHKFI